jgi:hypothetical protein
MVLLQGWAAGAPAEAQRRWAALDPNADGSSPVAWGASEEEARQRAVAACRRVSETCANGPATTDDLGDVFAVVCCKLPRTACAVSAAATRQQALHTVEKMFGDAGYANCALKHYMSAASGRKR